MKVRFCLSIGILSMLVLINSSVFAQAPPAQPGPEHAMLKSFEGNWDAVVKAGPQESKATMTSKMAVGGLWIFSDFKGEFGGAPFEGRGMDGFDLGKKKFISIWVDSMTSSPMTFEGTYDAKSKTLTMQGEGQGPDGKPAKYKNTTTFPDQDHQIFKMYLIGADGQESLMMTIEYTRKK